MVEDRAPLYGEVLAFDASPLPGVVVQVLPGGVGPTLSESMPKLIATTLSDERGRYRFPQLTPGTYKLRAHIPGGFADPLQDGPVVITLDGQPERIDFQLPSFKKGREGRGGDDGMDG